MAVLSSEELAARWRSVLQRNPGVIVDRPRQVYDAAVQAVEDTIPAAGVLFFTEIDTVTQTVFGVTLPPAIKRAIVTDVLRERIGGL